MTIHKSLKIKAGSNKFRSVLKREERIKILEKDGSWSDSDSIFGLKKTKVGARIKKKK